MATRNPPWQRDELILALDLYMQLGRKIPNEDHPQVIALSKLLNELPIHGSRLANFRNRAGVKLKLANFRAVEQPGRGMARGNHLEQIVWNDFAADAHRLRTTAAAISTGARSAEVQADVVVADEPDEQEFPEGRIIYRLHRARERNRTLVDRKKASVLRAKGKLACEACEFDFAAVYGPLGDGFIECHHAVALSTLSTAQKTKLEDLVLVCSNCHRMIHRKRPWLTAKEVRRWIVRG